VAVQRDHHGHPARRHGEPRGLSLAAGAHIGLQCLFHEDQQEYAGGVDRAAGIQIDFH